jgi:pimeloyl-ACP methyl ester carboxylesterase
MTVSHDESILLLDGDEIHVCQDGPRDAPALLLIHGTAASARSWEPILPLLSESRHVVRIDLLGCGRSARPAGASYAVEDQARRAASALDRLGVAHVVAVGHSSGGTVVTALAERRPDLVTGVVLVSTGPDMAAYTAKEIPLRGVSWAELTDDRIRQAVSDGFAPGFEIPQAFVDQFRDIDFAVFAATSQAVPAYLNERSLPDRLASLGTPLLVLFGEEDRRWRPASAADYRVVPGAIVRMLPGLGHSPTVEDPARTAALLLAFTAEAG